MKKYVFFFAVLLVVPAIAVLAPDPSFARYPDRPIQLVIAYVPGATGDITARMLADELKRFST